MRLPCRAYYRMAPLGHTRAMLGVGPARGVVLQGGHKYAAVVTTRIKDQNGHTISPSSDFTKIATGTRTASVGPLYGAAYDTVMTSIGTALGTAAQIACMSVFTTHTMEEELYGLRDSLETAPAAKLAWDATTMAPMGATKFTSFSPLPAGFTASLDAWLGVVPTTQPKLPDGTDDPDATLKVRAHDAIATIGTAVFSAINYLSVKPNGYVDPDNGNFARDATGKIVPAPEKPTAPIWVTFFVPKTTMPASGYPIVIAQHGLSSTRHWAFDLANTFCKNGWMVAAIDSVTFGARAPEAQYQVDQHSIWGGTYDGPDGLADQINGSFNGSGDLFGGLLNIGALRDQLRQAELDTAQLTKVLRSNPDLSPLQTGTTAPKIDPAHVAYVGDSLGGIEGAVAAAIEPNLNAWVLNVAGGGVATELASRSPVIGAQLNAGGLQFGFSADQLTDVHPLVTLIQTIVEAGDPLLYANHLVTAPHTLAGNATKPRNVLQFEVLFDELVTNEADEALARAAGLPLANPNVGSNAEISDIKNPTQNVRAITFPPANPDSSGAIHDVPVAGTTAVLVQIDPGTHGSDLVQSTGGRTFKAPWALFGTQAPFPTATHPYNVRCPYRETQITVAGFFTSAFAGQVPTVQGFKVPVRDLDDDGYPDATDADPNDPTIH